MATWYPLEEYTNEQYLGRDLATMKQELADLKREVEEYTKRRDELREVLDAAPEAVVYGLRLNAEGEYYNPLGEITWFRQ
jgi:hypothetical protein